MLRVGIISMAWGLVGTVATLAQTATSGVGGDLLQYGALGLCGLMVVLQFRERSRANTTMEHEREAFARRMEARDTAMLEMQKTTVETCRSLTEAAARCERRQENMR